MTPYYWADDMRIRSQALQDAFADHNTAANANLTPTLITPTTSVPWSSTYSPTTLQYIHTPFPGDQPSDTWLAATAYSYHKYGSFSPQSCDTFGPNCKQESG